MTSISTKSFTLTQDGALTLRVAPELTDAVSHWLPFSAHPTRESSIGATIEVRRSSVTFDEFSFDVFPAPNTHPTLRLGEVCVWVDDSRSHVDLVSARGLRGEIELHVHKACLYVTPRAISDLYAALTLVTALIFNRLGRALVHAAAVVPPSGAAWLLIGDSHAGKTTTTVNLSVAGWQYLSDDNVVLIPEEDQCVTAEGWPRIFHLDSGWTSGTPRGGHRDDVDPRTLLAGRWRHRAPLAGLLFPTVVADANTCLEPISRGEALTLLLRQSPWLLADRTTAANILVLLTAAAEFPAYRLTLGLDTYQDLERLTRCLEPLHAVM